MAGMDPDFLRYIGMAAGPTMPTPPVSLDPSQAIGATPGLDVGPLAPPALPPPPIATYQSMYPTPPPTTAPTMAPTMPKAPTLPSTPSTSTAAYNRAVGDETAALKAQYARKADIEQATGQRELAANEAARQQLMKNQQAREVADAGIAKRQEEQRNELDALSNTRVDPDRVFKNQTTGQQIAGLISVALGGYLTAGRGPNPAIEMIQKKIDDDVKAQMADLETKRFGIGAKNTLLQQQIAQNRDKADAAETLRLAQTKLVMDDIKAQAAADGSDIAKLEGDRLAAGIMKDAVDKNRAHWLQEHTAATQDAHLKIAQQQLALEQKKEDAAEKAKAEELRLRQEALDAKAKIPGSLQGLDPKELRALEVHGADGKLLGYSYSSERAKNTSDAIQSYENYSSDLKEYRDLLQKMGGRAFGGVAGIGKSEDLSKAQSVHKRLITNAKTMQKLGAMSESDYQLLLDQLPEPKTWTSTGSAPLPGVEDAMKQADVSIDKMVRGNVEGARRYTPEPPPPPPPGSVTGGLVKAPTIGRSAPPAGPAEPLFQGPALSMGGWMMR